MALDGHGYWWRGTCREEGTPASCLADCSRESAAPRGLGAKVLHS